MVCCVKIDTVVACIDFHDILIVLLMPIMLLMLLLGPITYQVQSCRSSSMMLYRLV